MSVRILIVDDHEGWRRQIFKALRNDLRYRVIGEAADGLEALRAAERLQPDLLVLDIGLPTLNGIEVARQVRASVPHARILFLSEQRSPEVAEAALGTGAYGYVVKSDAGGEFLPAIAAVAEGKAFVGARLAGNRIDRSLVPRAAQSIRHHDVLFSADDDAVTDGYARFVEDSLTAGGSAVLVGTPSRRQAVREKLQACGVDVDGAVAESRYVPLDVEETLSTFMVDGWPDEVRFLRVSRELVKSAVAASKGESLRATACGELAPSLWRQGNAEAAIRLEHLWDDLTVKSGLDTLCCYSVQPTLGAEDSRFVQRVCDAHSSARWS